VLADSAYTTVNGIWVPGYAKVGALQVPDAPQALDTVADVLRIESFEAITKSLLAGRPQATPRQVLPHLWRMGYYAGIKDPGQATTRSMQLLREIGGVLFPRIIIDTLVGQAKVFGNPARTRNDQGFVITTRDPTAEMTSEDKENVDAIKGLLMDGGVQTEHNDDGSVAPWSGDQREEADPFPILMEKAFRDTFTLAWTCIRLEAGRDPKACPVAFLKVMDAARMRLVDQKVSKGTGHDNELAGPNRLPKLQDGSYFAPAAQAQGYEPQFRKDIRVELVELDEQGRPANEYARGEVFHWARNQRSDVTCMGYGWPELASAVDLVAGLLVAAEYNLKFFTANNVPPGIVFASGDFDKGVRDRFLYDLSQPGSGGDKWHRLPFLFGDSADAKLQFIPFHQGEKEDMFWRTYIQWLINALTALFHLAAEEINFQAFLTQGGVQTATGGQQRVDTQRGTGIRPALAEFESLLNRNVISRFYPDRDGIGRYVIQFQNVIPHDDARERQFDERDLQQGVVSVNEVRARRDLRPVRDPLNRDLYKRVMAETLKQEPGIERHKSRLLDMVERSYDDLGGEWALWPDAPGNPVLLQVWQQEHQKDLGDGQEQEQQQPFPGQPGFGEEQGAPGQEQGEEQKPRWMLGEGVPDELKQAKHPAAEDIEALKQWQSEQEPEGKQPRVRKSLGARVLEVTVE